MQTSFVMNPGRTFSTAFAFLNCLFNIHLFLPTSLEIHNGLPMGYFRVCCEPHYESEITRTWTRFVSPREWTPPPPPPSTKPMFSRKPLGSQAFFRSLLSKVFLLNNTARVIWLCACVRYWPYHGDGTCVAVLRSVVFLLKPASSRQFSNLSPGAKSVIRAALI